ncbi:transposase family protein [Streptomyces rimosus]|uniref:transposase family protein n=1 Tax=Streptomyces rimosus TaxID=1927 RepID=UPI003CCFF689
MLVTLVRYRTGLPHVAPGERYGTARSTISRAIGEIRPLPAAHGLTVPTAPVSGCALWPTCSPTPKPRGSGCGSTAPRPRPAGLRPAGPSDGLSSPVRRSRTPSKPPPRLL